MVRSITLALLLLVACGLVRAEDFPADQVLQKVVTLAPTDKEWIARQFSAARQAARLLGSPGEGLSALKVRSLQKLAAGNERDLADSAMRRLELAFAASNAYLPAEATQRNEPGVAAASRAVAAAIFPDRGSVNQ